MNDEELQALLADPCHLGVDEVGRGPLAGPVVAAAVVLDPARPIEGLADSKKLTEKRRETLAAEIRDKALAFAIAEASVEEIDTINILQASLLAMKRAVEQLDLDSIAAAFHGQLPLALIDGNRCPDLPVPARAVIKGDARVPAISAASIIAKVSRDALMKDYHERWPEFSFHQHKAYGSRAHLAELAEHGPLPVHRRSFAPVKKLLD